MYVLGTAKYFLAVIECNRSPSLFGVDNAVLSRLTRSAKLFREVVPDLKVSATLSLETALSPSQSPLPCSAAKKLRSWQANNRGNLHLASVQNEFSKVGEWLNFHLRWQSVFQSQGNETPIQKCWHTWTVRHSYPTRHGGTSVGEGYARRLGTWYGLLPAQCWCCGAPNPEWKIQL